MSAPPVDDAARLEDLRDLAAFGETRAGAAQRMGLTYTALEKWRRDHARPEWEQLIANEQAIGKGARRGRVLA